jgi:DUF1680 family protein
VLWNWRMLQVTGDAKYADVVELALYNSVLSGISLNGKKFLYTNPLAFSDDLPFQQRWSKERVPYISLSNCCPPNVVRTIAEVSNYAYSVSDNSIWVNLYGSNQLSTKLKDGSPVQLTQETDYPWEGQVHIKMQKTPGKPFVLRLRIPQWCNKASIKINGRLNDIPVVAGEYLALQQNWKAGDVITLDMDMPVTLIESNPLVEETRNQVAVKRGPVVYCLESGDFPKGVNIFNIILPVKDNLQPKKAIIEKSRLVVLEGTGLVQNETRWDNALYREIKADLKSIPVKLIPYYAWANRGESDMTVWMLLQR